MRLQTLETSRLVLRKPVPDDHGTIVKWISDPTVMKHQGGPWLGERQSKFFTLVEEHWQNYGFGHFMATQKDGAERVGLFSLKWIHGSELANLGFFLDRAYWKRGLATEGASGLVELAMRKFALQGLEATRNPRNAASGRVLEKLGFVRESEREVQYLGASLGVLERWVLFS